MAETPVPEGGDPTPGRRRAGDGGGPAHRWRLLLVVAAAVVALDQLTKAWALEELRTRTIDVVWTLRFRYVENEGAAFSIVGGGGWGPVITLAALAIIAVLLVQVRSARSGWTVVAVGLITGGALGNLIDRVARGDEPLHGAVIDFIDFQWWPVFNVADMGVVVGAVLLVVASVLFDGEPRTGEPPTDEPATDEPAADDAEPSQ